MSINMVVTPYNPVQEYFSTALSAKPASKYSDGSTAVAPATNDVHSPASHQQSLVTNLDPNLYP
jgi:hypothetical protein